MFTGGRYLFAKEKNNMLDSLSLSCVALLVLQPLHVFLTDMVRDK